MPYISPSLILILNTEPNNETTLLLGILESNFNIKTSIINLNPNLALGKASSISGSTILSHFLQ